MKNSIWLLILIKMFCLPFSAAAQTMPARVLHQFRVGEELIYEVKVLGIPAGLQHMKIEGKTLIDSYSCYHISSRTQSNAFFSLFYRLDNRVQVYLDEERLSLRKLVRDLREGPSHHQSTVFFDLEKEEARIIEKEKTSIISIPSFILDAASLAYYLRSIELEIGKEIFLNIITPLRLEKYVARVEKIEKVYTPLKSFTAYKIVYSKEKEGINLWISADSSRLPVRIDLKGEAIDVIGLLKKVN